MLQPGYFGFHTGHDFNDQTNPHHIMRPYGLDAWSFEYTVAGRALVNDARGVETLEPGDFTLSPAETPQDFQMDPLTGHWEHLWVAFTPRKHWLDEGLLAWPRLTASFMKLTIPDNALRARLVARLDAAVLIGLGPMARRELFVMNMLEEILLWCESVNPLTAHGRPDPRIQQAVEYLCAHFGARIRVTDLAEMSHLSSSRFAHLFEAQVGYSPLRYQELQRIDRARTMLVMTRTPIADIAEHCGYPTPNFFSRIFKRHTGMTPQAYRRVERGKGEASLGDVNG